MFRFDWTYANTWEDLTAWKHCSSYRATQGSCLPVVVWGLARNCIITRSPFRWKCTHWYLLQCMNQCIVLLYPPYTCTMSNNIIYTWLQVSNATSFPQVIGLGATFNMYVCTLYYKSFPLETHIILCVYTIWVIPPGDTCVCVHCMSHSPLETHVCVYTIL